MSGARLLWLTGRYPPLKGGMAVSCARQVRGLRKRGFEVDVLAFQRAGTQAAIAGTEGGSDIYVPREASPGATPNLAWALIRQRHCSEPYSAVVGFGASWPGFLAVTFAAWMDLPATVLVRGNDMDRDWFLPRQGAWVREALARASSIGAVSLEKVARIQGLYPGKRVLWTPNGIDARRWELLASDARRRDEARALLGGEGRRIAGLFGELKFKKRIPFWLEAVRDAGLLSRLALLVVGSLDEETARILDDPAVGPRNLRLPFCPPDELPGLYAACDLVAIPSAFEGMPNVLLEAMACGAVPLVSDAGAMGDVVEDGVTGFVFRAENRDAAGEAARRALEIPAAELAEMSRKACAVVRERFTVEREIGALVELLGRPTAPPPQSKAQSKAQS